MKHLSTFNELYRSTYNRTADILSTIDHDARAATIRKHAREHGTGEKLDDHENFFSDDHPYNIRNGQDYEEKFYIANYKFELNALKLILYSTNDDKVSIDLYFTEIKNCPDCKGTGKDPEGCSADGEVNGECFYCDGTGVGEDDNLKEKDFEYGDFSEMRITIYDKLKDISKNDWRFRFDNRQDAIALKSFLVDHFKGKGLEKIRVNHLYKNPLNPSFKSGTNNI